MHFEKREVNARAVTINHQVERIANTVIRAYDAVMVRLPGFGGVADRTSYVIAPDGKILLSYTALAPDEHVTRTLAAVQKWRADHPN